MIGQKIEKLIEETTYNQKITPITYSNFNEFFPLYKFIYEKQFKIKLNADDMKKWLKNSHMFILPISNREGAFIRCKKLMAPNKYLEIEKLKIAGFISDLAAYPSGHGYGDVLMKFAINKAKNQNIPLITVPWKDDLIKFYEKYGFKTYYPKNKKLPKVIQIKGNK